MYDYLRDELPALVQSQFNVSDRCAISGHSMGGHGALIMALKNPGKYTSFGLCANCESVQRPVGNQSV